MRRRFLQNIYDVKDVKRHYYSTIAFGSQGDKTRVFSVKCKNNDNLIGRSGILNF